jgi:hypothetical protein
MERKGEQMTREEANKRMIQACKRTWNEKTCKEIFKALEQEPCEDCIRRSAVGLTDFEIIMCNGDYREALKIVLEKIAKAPPVKPQYTDDEIQKMQDLEQAEIQKAYALGQEDRPTGHWEWLTEDKYRCSSCNHETRVDECMNKPMYDFCPFCGAKMAESEEV